MEEDKQDILTIFRELKEQRPGILDLLRKGFIDENDKVLITAFNNSVYALQTLHAIYVQEYNEKPIKENIEKLII